MKIEKQLYNSTSENMSLSIHSDHHFADSLLRGHVTSTIVLILRHTVSQGVHNYTCMQGGLYRQMLLVTGIGKQGGLYYQSHSVLIQSVIILWSALKYLCCCSER